MQTLLSLSLQGSAVFGVVLFLDWVLGGRMQARWRRCWWILVPCAFLLPWKLNVISLPAKSIPESLPGLFPLPHSLPDVGAITSDTTVGSWMFVCWLAGAVISFLFLLVGSWKASRRWTGRRFSTDSQLLSLLEDGRAQAGVKAPVGIIVAEDIPTPAIFGWLRPRILLPAALTDPVALRHVILHELVHFRSADIPLGWLYALVRCVHWFNPLAYLAAWQWARYREEAADEAVLREVVRPAEYGETLVGLAGTPAPCGALGIGESFSHLKTRIGKIMKHHTRTPHKTLALLVFAALAAALLLRTVQAEEDPKAAAVAAMEVWLKGIDEGDYEQSWDQASAFFRGAVTKEQWVAALKAVRGPLGKCEKRQLISAAYQTEIPENGTITKGDFVIAQFDAAYANMKYTVETVTFMKDDGVWKAGGYFVKPGK